MAPILRSAVACLVLASTALSSTSTCSADACLDAVSYNYYLHDSKKLAPHECRRYLDSTVTPEPSTTTHTHVTTLTSFVTSTTDIASTVTATDVITVPDTATVTSTHYWTSLQAKRSVETGCPAPSSDIHTYPTYASACVNGAAFSSACSCVGVTTGTTTTLPMCTSTVHVTATDYTTASVQVTSLSLTTSVTQESVAIPVATSTSVVTIETCTYVGSNGVYFNRYYVGASYSEATENPGEYNNFGFPVLTHTYSAGYSDCAAIAACALDTIMGFAPDINYASFDLHFLTMTNEWECVEYFGSNSGVSADSYFSVYNEDISIAYGYTSPEGIV